MYVKIFPSMYQGSLRGNADALLVFTNLLAHADQDGHVDITQRVVADEVGISLGRVQKAIDYLEAADPMSRTQDEEGRRILRAAEHRTWGWYITNYDKYRGIRGDVDRREQNRLASQRYRARKANARDDATEGNVSKSAASSRVMLKPAQGEGEGEGLKNTKKPKRQQRQQPVDNSTAAGRGTTTKDPALLKIAADEAKAAPMPVEVAMYVRKLRKHQHNALEIRQ